MSQVIAPAVTLPPSDMAGVAVTDKQKSRGTAKPSQAQKEYLWCEAMLKNGGNKTKAALSAGYSKGGAEKAGQRMSGNVRVAAMLKRMREKLNAEVHSETVLTILEVKESLARDERFDPINLVDKHGAGKPIQDIDRDTRMALRGIKIKQTFSGEGKDRRVIGQEIEYKFPEKTAAREQGMKHFGMYEKDNSQKADPILDLLRQIAERGAGIPVKR